MKMLELNKIHQIHALRGLKQMDSEFIDCLVTSPPYWALRNYSKNAEIIWDGKEGCKYKWGKGIKAAGNHEYRAGKTTTVRNDLNKKIRKGNTTTNFCTKCSAWKGQLGLEPTFDLYIKHLCDIFDEVKRVLKKTGTVWVNIGETYSQGGGEQVTNTINKSVQGITRAKTPDMHSKCLILILFRFAIEMINRGWILRNTLIWQKPNCMPSSVKDRFTVDFEYLFFFVKNKKYYFEQQFEPIKGDLDQRGNNRVTYNIKTIGLPHSPSKNAGFLGQNPLGRNKRCVWPISTKPFPEAHFAVYPEELIETPIKAGCPKGGIVLDPFGGAGTTALVARKLGRDSISLEINPEYIKIANKRIKDFVKK